MRTMLPCVCIHHPYTVRDVGQDEHYAALYSLYEMKCMYAYMHICIYAYMHICIHACMYVCMHACMHVHVYACMHVCMHACMHVCMYACASMYAEWTMSPTIPCIHCKRRDWLRRHACAHEHLGGRNVVRGTHEEEGYACRIHVYIHLISDSEYKAAHTKRNAVPAVV